MKIFGLPQKMLSTLYNVEINYHIKKIYSDNELTEDSTIRKFRIVQKEGNREILQDAGKISHKIACNKAETEFEKYRIIQDKIYLSDFDKYMNELEEVKK